MVRSSGSHSVSQRLRLYLQSFLLRSLETLRTCHAPRKHWVPAPWSAAPFCAGGNETEMLTSCFRHRTWGRFQRNADPQSVALSHIIPFILFSTTQGQNFLIGLPTSLFCSNPSLLIFFFWCVLGRVGGIFVCFQHVLLFLNNQVKLTFSKMYFTSTWNL